MAGRGAGNAPVCRSDVRRAKLPQAQATIQKAQALANKGDAETKASRSAHKLGCDPVLP